MKAYLAHPLRFLGLPRILHELAYPQTLAVLMYHGVTQSEMGTPDWCFLEIARFRQQMEYLKRHFDVLSLTEAIDRLQRGKIQRPTAAITFDDGYQNTFDLVCPVLKDLGFPATVFLCTDLVGSDETVWFCRLLEAFSESQLADMCWQGRRLSLATPAARSNAACAMQEELKKLPPAQLDHAMKELARALKYDLSSPISRTSPFRMLDVASVRQMSSDGLIEFGAHTGSHTILSKLPLAQKQSEIKRSVAAIESLTGRQCAFFAYPNGMRQDYDSASIACLQELGIQAAFTTIQEPNTAHTPPLELRRYGIGSNVSMAEFQFSVHHLLSLYQRWSRSNGSTAIDSAAPSLSAT